MNCVSWPAKHTVRRPCIHVLIRLVLPENLVRSRSLEDSLTAETLTCLPFELGIPKNYNETWRIVSARSCSYEASGNAKEMYIDTLIDVKIEASY